MSVRRAFAWEPVLAALGVVVLAGTAAWWWLDVLEPPRAPVPGHRGAAFEPLSAAMPPIGDFKVFYINDDNPFVPWREREAERQRIQQPERVTIKARPPSEIKVQQPPVLSLPKAKSGGGDAPKVVGFTKKPDGAIEVLATLPGETKPRLMKPDDSAGRWTFVGIEGGNVAVFRDETKREYRLVIGGK